MAIKKIKLSSFDPRLEVTEIPFTEKNIPQATFTKEQLENWAIIQDMEAKNSLVNTYRICFFTHVIVESLVSLTVILSPIFGFSLAPTPCIALVLGSNTLSAVMILVTRHYFPMKHRSI